MEIDYINNQTPPEGETKTQGVLQEEPQKEIDWSLFIKHSNSSEEKEINLQNEDPVKQTLHLDTNQK